MNEQQYSRELIPTGAESGSVVLSISYYQDVARVHGSVRHNHSLRKCVDTILTKVRNT